MAPPTFVQLGAVDVNGNTAASVVFNFAGTSGLDITGEAANDYALCVIHKESTAAVTPPAGWDTLLETSQDTGGFKFRVHVYGRRLSGSELTQTWSWSGSTWRYAECVVYRGVDPVSSPVVSIVADEETAQNINPVHPGITIASTDAALVWFICNYNDIDNTTPPTGFTHRDRPTLNARNILTYDDLTTVPGSSGTVSATLSGDVEWPLTILVELASSTVTTVLGAAWQALPPVRRMLEREVLATSWLQPTPPYYFDVNISATGGLLIRKPALALLGTEAFSSTGSLLIQEPVLSVVAAQGTSGAATLTIVRPSLALSGLERFTATGVFSIARPTLAAAGLERFSGTASLTLDNPNLTLGGTAGNVVNGFVTLLMQEPAFSSSGLLRFLATASITLARPSLSSTGIERFAGTVTLLIQEPLLSGLGGERYAGAAALSIGRPSLALSGSSSGLFTGTVALTLDNPFLAAAGLEAFVATGSLTLDNPTLVLVGVVPHAGVIALVIDQPDFVLFGTGGTFRDIHYRLGAPAAKWVVGEPITNWEVGQPMRGRGAG